MHTVTSEYIAYRPIGHFRTPHKMIAGMPIQPIGALGVQGTIVLLPGFVQGLQDLDDFSHVIVLYHLHQTRGHSLQVTPFLDTEEPVP